MRHIALREFKPGLTTTLAPPSSYLEKTNGTLEAEDCVLRIDANGFMVSAKPEKSTDVRVLFLGGSEIENLYIDDDQRIATLVEATAGGWGHGVKTYSAGISSANLLHMMNTLVNKGIPLRPSIVVYYVSLWPDIHVSSLEGGFWNPNSSVRPVLDPEEDDPGEVSFADSSESGLADAARLLRSLCDLCRNFDMSLLMGTWPVYKYDDFVKNTYGADQESFEAEREQGFVMNELVREIARAKSCSLIDLDKAFEDLDHHQYFYDLAHPNVRGCAQIASITSEVIRPHLEQHQP